MTRTINMAMLGAFCLVGIGRPVLADTCEITNSSMATIHVHVKAVNSALPWTTVPVKPGQTASINLASGGNYDLAIRSGISTNTLIDYRVDDINLHQLANLKASPIVISAVRLNRRTAFIKQGDEWYKSIGEQSGTTDLNLLSASAGKVALEFTAKEDN